MTENIKVDLYRIKENIKAVEQGEKRLPVFEEIEHDFLEMIELIKLYLISERESYYGYFLMNLQFSVDFCSNSIAGIRLNTFPPVFVTNPLLLCTFKLKEIIYIICHEIEHLILNHPAEMLRNCPDLDLDTLYRFNVAADASVNDRINQDILDTDCKFLSAPDGLITSDSLAKMFQLKKVRPLESYAYYFALIRKKPIQNLQNQQNQMLRSFVEGQESTDNNEEENRDSSNEGDIITRRNCGKLQDHDWQTGEDAEDAQAVLKEFINHVVDTMSEESRGLMPGRFFSQVALLNQPPQLSWQNILKKYIGTISANKRKTRARLNRRQPERFDLSGCIDDKILKIVVAIDTSASVDDKMIAEIFNEIFAILSKRKHTITVIECDSEVQRVYAVRNKNDIQKKVAGRGGTAFSPVIAYINKNKYFRDALLLYFTDGYGESNIPKPMTYRNIWVIVDEENYLSLKEPYGIKLALKEDKHLSKNLI